MVREVRSKRGYLLNYHEMLAASDPALLAAYDTFYERLTLKPRVLSAADRELVWVPLLISAKATQGGTHIDRARAAGVSEAAISAAMALAGAALAYEVPKFVAANWASRSEPMTAIARYLEQCEAAATGLPTRLAEIILVVCHAARREHEGLRLHLPRAFAAGATVAEVAEALSYLFLPCGGNVLIDAVDAWTAADDCPQPIGLESLEPGLPTG